MSTFVCPVGTIAAALPAITTKSLTLAPIHTVKLFGTASVATTGGRPRSGSANGRVSGRTGGRAQSSKPPKDISERTYIIRGRVVGCWWWWGTDITFHTEAVNLSRQGMLLLGKDLIVSADSLNGLHSTGQIIVAGNRGLVSSTGIRCEVFAVQDGLDPEHFESCPVAILCRCIKPLPLNLYSLFASKLQLKLHHGTVHELFLAIWLTKEYSMILGILEGSKILFNRLGGIVNRFDHVFHLVNVSTMVLFWGINLSEIVQQVTGCKMGRELAADIEAFKHVLAKLGE